MTTNDSREAAFLREALADPTWLLQQIDIHADRAAFLRVPESTYRQSPFLDHRLQAPRQQPVITHLSTLVDAAGDRLAPPAAWIFHPGHVGSTWLTRVLGELNEALPVREPLPLRNVAGWFRELEHPLALLARPDYQRLERAIFVMLGRTYTGGQKSLVKATSDCCILLERALGANPDSRAIWLHVDLETFLAGMLRNDVRRQETREFAQTRLWDLHELLGDRSLRLHEMDVGSITAAGWLANQGHMLKAREAGFGEQVLEVHFHDLLERPEEQLRAIVSHLGLPADAAALKRMLASRWHNAYAKDPSSPFSTKERYRQLQDSRESNAEIIAAGLAFAKDLCRRFPVLEPLRSRLSPTLVSPEASSGKPA